jgi:hypothetical protein
MNDLAAAADEYALGDEWQWVRVEVVASTEVFVRWFWLEDVSM